MAAEPIDITVTRSMSSSPEAVWSTASDLSRLGEWLAFAQQVTDVSGSGDTVGSTYTVKTRAYEPNSTWRVAEVDPGRRQVHESEMPILTGVRSSLEVAQAPSGSVVTVHWHGTPKNVAGRLMRGMMDRQIKANWEKSLEQLDRLAAGSPA